MPIPPPRAWRAVLLAPVVPMLLAAGCGERIDQATGNGDPTKEAAMTADRVPDDDGIQQQLLAADRRFAAEVAAAEGGERARIWAGWFAPDGRQLVPAAVVTGPAAILGLMAPAFADPGFSLLWDPDLAAGTDPWGWTSGRYVSTRPSAEGPVTREGRYLTVWQRQPDGTWKVAVDTGVPDGQ